MGEVKDDTRDIAIEVRTTVRVLGEAISQTVTNTEKLRADWVTWKERADIELRSVPALVEHNKALTKSLQDADTAAEARNADTEKKLTAATSALTDARNQIHRQQVGLKWALSIGAAIGLAALGVVVEQIISKWLGK